MKKLLAFLFAMFFAVPVIACESNEIDILGDGTQCETAHFVLTTISTTDSFQFVMSAAGTFYVDCGNSGTLQGTGVAGNTISRPSDVTEAIYTCTWNSTDEQTVRFGGIATNYSTSTSTAAIGFNIDNSINDVNAPKIASISGNLSVMFTYIKTNYYFGAQPRFVNTFRYAINLTSVPDTLFANYTIPASYMFNRTFARTGLTLIPEKLFSGITGAASYAFEDTFANCSSLTSIPEKLFSSVSGNASGMFQGTFENCTSLVSIPGNLFSGVRGANERMFAYTFDGCSSLTQIPENLFADVYGNAHGLFFNTFRNCKNLTSIPENLFAGISGVSGKMKSHIFANTFYGCSNLKGYIPPSTFSGLIANGSPTADYMWSSTFYGTKLATTCPSGTTEYDTGYQTDWGRVSCYVDTSQTCDTGQYLPKFYNSCADCSMNSYCIGGTYSFNETIDQGIQSCASGTFSPTGSAVCYPHILHVGDDVMYVRSTKLTTPSLNIDMDNDGIADFFVNMTTTPTTMNRDSVHYFRVQWESNDYYVCDDTTYVAPAGN